MANITLSSDKVCRLCLVKEQDVYLGDKLAKDAKYWQVATSFTNIKYSPYDGLPQSICRMCACQLKNIHIFKQRCEASHETLLINFGKEEHVEYLDEVNEIPGIKTIIMQESGVLMEDQTEDENIKIEDDDGIDYYSEPEIVESSVTVKPKHEAAEGTGRRPREKRHQCSECGALVESPSKLVRHLRTHVLDNYKVKHSSRNGNIYSCKKCGQTYLKVKQLRAHVVSGNCKKVSPEAVKMEGKTGMKNIQKNEDEVLFRCTKCSFTHESAEEMIEHYRMSKSCSEEVKEKPFMCEFCHKQFRYKSCLKKHFLCHTGEKRFECDICFKKFTRNGEVAIHKRRHSNIRPYVCEECGSAFGKSGDLVRHRRIHTGEAPYQCMVCLRRFIWDTALKVHMYSHTGEKPYECKKCPKAYSSRSGLVKHRASNHQEPEGDASSETATENKIKILRKSSRLAT